MNIRIDKADTVFSKAIRTRDKFKCVRCDREYPEGKGLQVHHFFGRRYENTRFDPENVISVCFGCHRFFHENPLQQVEFFEERLGKTRFDELKLRANMYCKRDRKMALLKAKKYLELMEKENDSDL
jgi:5-methylcytosine-specific restriction endonuclease McrA